jgi:hypothetical protein
MKTGALFLILSALSLSALAVPVALSHTEIAANAANGLRLISLAKGAQPVWKTEDEVLNLIRAKTGFVRGGLFSLKTDDLIMSFRIV